jgi:hypothetical protein
MSFAVCNIFQESIAQFIVINGESDTAHQLLPFTGSHYTIRQPADDPFRGIVPRSRETFTPLEFHVLLREVVRSMYFVTYM